MNPNIWGPPAWFFIHSIAFNYPENPSPIEKTKYKQFFESLKYVIPCPVCQEHYIVNLKKHDLDKALIDKISLIKWTINMHNSVNIINNKKKPDYSQIIKLYKNIYIENSPDLLCKTLFNIETKTSSNIETKTSNYNWKLVVFTLTIPIIIYIAVQHRHKVGCKAKYIRTFDRNK